MTDLIPRDAALKIYTDWTLGPEEAIAKLRAIPAIDPAAIREAALREAVNKLRDCQDSLRIHGYPDTALSFGIAADGVESMIGEKK